MWGRGRLLRLEPGASLLILSIDYGVTATLPLSHVLPLPPQCKGIPPLVSGSDWHVWQDPFSVSLSFFQAIPCRLLGVVPVPVCTVVQENAAGVRVRVHVYVCIHIHFLRYTPKPCL